MNTMRSAMLAGLLGGALLLPATTAAAATTGILAVPKGYTIVTAFLDAPTGKQTHGSVTCPGKEQPSGGGAFIEHDDLADNINSSYPSGQSWDVDINNVSGSDTTYYVFAVCLAFSAGYTVVSSSFPGTVGDDTASWAVTCPADTKVVGGGAVSNSSSTAVDIDSTVPNQLTGGHTAWRVAISSSDAMQSDFQVYAVCRPKPAGYSIQFGSPVLAGPDRETDASVNCPGASVVIGGGGFASFATADDAIDMNSSWPTGSSQWAIAENDGETIGRDIEAAVVCAGT
ncbi:MAG TPA: hypothetical protein VGL63_13045 [Streptosporangiaceae bacterium]|jgi:hypothetical protein